MSTHNICFHGELRKIPLHFIEKKKRLIWNYVSLFFRQQVRSHARSADRSYDNYVPVCGAVPLLPQVHAVLPGVYGY